MPCARLWLIVDIIADRQHLQLLFRLHRPDLPHGCRLGQLLIPARQISDQIRKRGQVDGTARYHFWVRMWYRSRFRWFRRYRVGGGTSTAYRFLEIDDPGPAIANSKERSRVNALAYRTFADVQVPRRFRD